MSDQDVKRAEITSLLIRQATSTIADVRNGAGLIGLGLRRLSGTGTVAGKVLTALCLDGSSRAVGRALKQADAGDILCISAPFETACIGDLVAAEMERVGIAAVILDGFARDAASLARSPISFFVRGTNPVAQKIVNPGEVGIAITIGGIMILPGDWVIADDDGAMVIPQSEIEMVAVRSAEASAREDRILARIKAGEPIEEAFAAES